MYWLDVQGIRRGGEGGGGGKGEKDPVLSKHMRDAGNSAFSLKNDEVMQTFEEKLYQKLSLFYFSA